MDRDTQNLLLLEMREVAEMSNRRKDSKILGLESVKKHVLWVSKLQLGGLVVGSETEHHPAATEPMTA